MKAGLERVGLTVTGAPSCTEVDPDLLLPDLRQLGGLDAPAS